MGLNNAKMDSEYSNSIFKLEVIIIRLAEQMTIFFGFLCLKMERLKVLYSFNTICLSSGKCVKISTEFV